MHFYFFGSFFIINNQYLPLTPEAVTRSVLWKKVFLEILQNSQEKACARVSFLKKWLWHRCFPVNFAIFLRTPFFIEHLWTTASVTLHISSYCCTRTRNFSKTILTKTYASFIFHTQINISSKNCNIAVIPIFSQFTSMYTPKN